MGYQELIESLRKKAEERIEEARRQAHDEVLRYREKVFSEFEDFKKQYLKEVESNALREIYYEISMAKRQAYLLKNMAIHRLSDRLKAIAKRCLREMREKGDINDYERIFEKLTRELPSAKWARVWIAPADRELARRFFPYAEILSDPGITGGLRVETDDGITVDNTLEKRLERVWPEILPEILKELGVLS